MFLLKQHLRTTTYQFGHAATYDALLTKLAELRIKIEKEDKDKSEIVAHVLGLCVNLGLWRCWSDRILIEVKKVGENSSSASIYAIPNLLRVIMGKDEMVTDVEKLVSQLAALNPCAAPGKAMPDSN